MHELDIDEWDWLFIILFEADFFLFTKLLLQDSDLLNKMLPFIEFWVESLDFWKIDPFMTLGFRIGVKLATIFRSFLIYCFKIWGYYKLCLFWVELDFWTKEDEFLKTCLEVFWVDKDSSEAFKVMQFAWSWTLLIFDSVEAWPFEWFKRRWFLWRDSYLFMALAVVFPYLAECLMALVLFMSLDV